MKAALSTLAALLLYVALGLAQRPSAIPVCDYYAKKTVGANTPENQRIVMQLVLHSALLGNFSKYNTVKVDGFVGALQTTTYKGEYVDLNGYFNGGFASANLRGKAAAVNFFDDGGIDAARQLKPGNGNTTSAQ